MSTFLAKNAQILVTMDAQRREIKNGALYLCDGMIEQVGTTDELPQSADRVLDLSGQIVLPGLVNTHHHFDQTLTRAIPAAQELNLFPWLQAHYRLWARRHPDASRTCTLIALAELALSGCTTAFDHTYIFKNGSKVDDQIEAAKEIGVRFHASRGSMSLGESQGGLPPDECVEEKKAILQDCERVIRRYHDASPGSMTRIVLAPCSPFSVTSDLMTQSAALARKHKVSLHTHLCETLDEERYTLERWGMRPVDYMESLGWVGPDVWFAHAIHVSDSEIIRFAQWGCGVSHCPCSNMRLASGIAPVRKYFDSGVKVGIGVDGSASNDGNHLLGEVRQAMLLARLRIGLPPPVGPESVLLTSHPMRRKEWMTARQALEIATRGGAAVLGRDDIGALEVGRCGDFFSLRLDTLEFAGALHDPVAATLFCSPQKAHYTVIHGKLIVDQGRLASLDMSPIIQAHNRYAYQMLADSP